MSTTPLAERAWTADRLRVRQYAGRDDMGKAAAAEAAEAIRQKLNTQGTVRIVFAAAPSQNEFLEALAAAEGIDWARVTAFHMDEYIGLSTDAPQRFSHFLTTKLFSRVRPGKVHLLDSTAEPAQECARYAALLREAPLDIVCLGIGENGHIAFNDPPVADFNDPELVKRVKLDDLCREQQVHDGCFAKFEDVPEYAMTLTVPALMSAGQLFCIVPGAAKRRAVRGTLEGPITTACPASILRTHADCRMYLDRDSSPDE
ncbi:MULTISPECIES: glucosamine-6-phosphate deaminase [Paenibacillus]|uniref:Glucosamine-6-phosphate deaminase n=1 Tax=Paenibacillus albilobatus TaxID=2716884 RepID=A0A920CAN7_9BACL|nr:MULTISPECIES: glucosamine-6-phosphate deaminase [Paenibacillus]GIO32470.1 glucosamine-6-phosphate deaminase [Paenibacillus albilobatus]